VDDDVKPIPRYKIGDLVRCMYDLYQYFYAVYSDDEYENTPIYGIIVDVDYAMYSEIFGYDVLYVVLCMDGIYRFFTEDEIYQIE
tara:strand:- start:2313 stop:2567 length:255 start_codon:yes stop_codon:yes gene_type:complete